MEKNDDRKRSLAGPDRPDDHDFSRFQLLMGGLVLGFLMIAFIVGVAFFLVWLIS